MTADPKTMTAAELHKFVELWSIEHGCKPYMLITEDDNTKEWRLGGIADFGHPERQGYWTKLAARMMRRLKEGRLPSTPWNDIITAELPEKS